MIRLLHVDGRAVRRLTVDDLDDGLPDSGYLWLDLDAPTPDEVEVLRHPTLGLTRLVVEDLVEDDHLPKVDVIDDHLLLTVHAMDLDLAATELTTREVDFVLAPSLLVTHHASGIASVRHVHERLREKGQASGVGRPVLLMHRILDVMNDVFVSFITHMEQRLDVIEEDILSDPTETTRRDIYELQRDVIQVRRAVVPQAEVLRRLGRTPTPVVSEDDLVLFRDIHDHLYRMAELSDSYRQLLDSALDSYQSAVDADLNEMLKVLTLVSATLLPISVLAGIYGMNFVNMPELTWSWGYFALWGVFLLVIGVQLLLFRRAGWIGGRAEREVQRRRDALPSALDIPLVGSVLRVPVVAGVKGARLAGRAFGGLLRGASEVIEDVAEVIDPDEDEAHGEG